MHKRKGKREIICSYCGERVATDNEHVFPRSLYPASKATPKVQRLTIPACKECNEGWSYDEAHFRNILTTAGAQRELWETKMKRSFFQSDGACRIRDLLDTMDVVQTAEGIRLKVYPGRDERVLRVVRKIIRGLCHHHQIISAVPERRVWADVLKYPIAEEFVAEMNYEHRDQEIVEYRYQVLREHGIDSAWLITFFQTVTFIGLVSVSEDGFIT